MAQWLRTLSVFPEDLGLIPNTHIEAYQFQGILYPLLASIGTRYTRGAQIFMQVK